MPGAYAQLSVVNDAQTRAGSTGLRDETLASLGLPLKFLELGSLGPDYPYLALKRDQPRWADAMHYTCTATLVRAGVEAVGFQAAPNESGSIYWLVRSSCLADMTRQRNKDLKYLLEEASL